MIHQTSLQPLARRSATAPRTYVMLLLIVCLVFGLVTDIINPARLQNYLQSVQLEVNDDSAAAAADDNDVNTISNPTYSAIIILDGAKADNNSHSTNETSYSDAPSSNRTNNNKQFTFATGGAKEWHKNWMWASRKGKESAFNQKTDSLQYSSHDDFVASELQAQTDATVKYMNDMKARYIGLNALPDYRARGLGWIDTRLDMMLTILVAGNFTNDHPSDRIMTTNSTFSPGTVSIFIVDVVGNHKCTSVEDHQPPLTIWVRANGPEIHAGTALPHLFLPTSQVEYRHRCVWRYDFHAAVAGTYSIDAKVLTFNGFANYDESKCRTENFPSRGELFDKQDKQTEEPDLPVVEKMNREAMLEFATNRSFTHHRGLIGFKLYGPAQGCCQVNV